MTEPSSDHHEPKDVSSVPELDDVTVVWGDACENANLVTQTIKGTQAAATVQPLSLNISIKERSIRSTDDPSGPREQDQESDDYDLIELIGKGGMGLVFSARQTSVDRVVAVKMLRGDHDSSSRKEMFLQEAVVTADLDHPNIVPVHELGTDSDGSLFYSMKQVRGQAWHRVIRKKTLDENLDVLLRVADAIAFAHSRGIVHRDLKPENVMLGHFGEVWLMDWGLALPTQDYSKPSVKAPPMGGTPAYMPPEMAIPGRSVGPWSDIYLLGATLFEIITRRPPHAGSSVIECVRSAARNTIVSTDQSGGLLEIAYRAMATDPDDRPKTVADFRSSIREWISQSESLAIMKNAQERLEQGEQTRDYEDFVRAIFGFEQAHELFPANHEATQSLLHARYRYAEIAADKQDFDLAVSQLDSNEESHQPLLRRIRAAKDDQEARTHRLRRQRLAVRCLVALTCVLLVSGVVVASMLRMSALQLANTNDPAMFASMSLQSGMRRSLGSLRGWVALGDPQFKVDRSDAWELEIWPAMAELKRLASQSSTLTDDDRLAELSMVLDDLYEEQWWIEDVAQTPGNYPATDLLHRDIEPIEANISRSLRDLASPEQTSHNGRATFAKLPQLTRLQWSFDQTHRNLINVIDNGTNAAGSAFMSDLRNTELRLQQILEEKGDFAPEQIRTIDWIAAEFFAYRRLSLAVIEHRDSEQANVAQWRLRTQAIPTSEHAESIIGNIVTGYRAATVRNSSRINRISAVAISVGIASVLGIVLACVLTVIRRFSKKRIAAAVIIAPFLTCPGNFALAQTGSQLAAEAVIPTAEPADVFVRVSQILGEIELIRLEMGKPSSQPLPITVSDAAPHEVYFQALTMFQKADALCFEQIRQRRAAPPKPTEKIRPADVLVVVNAVAEMIAELKAELGISEQVDAVLRDPKKTPTDVFVAISKANHQLNRMLERQFTPSNVYQQVTLAVSYGSTLLAVFPGAKQLPSEPAFERRKTPADVYRRLLDCYTRVRQIAIRSGVKMIRYEIADAAIESAAPSDVYDIASLLVSELAHLHSIHGGLKPPRRVFYPGRIYPSHVYQRAGMLEKQIVQLEELTKEQTDWLGR